MADIKVGDKVQLKSGGPYMTVDEIGKLHSDDETTRAWCIWFDGTDKKSDNVSLTSLIHVKNT